MIISNKGEQTVIMRNKPYDKTLYRSTVFIKQTVL